HHPNFCAKRRITFSACGAGDRIKPGVERDSAQPQEYGATNTIKPANAGGSFFVLRAFIIIKVASIAVARFAGLLINHPSYLGLRAVALHPRLYSVARIRGLGFGTRNFEQKFG